MCIDAGWISGEAEAVSARNRRDGSRAVRWAITMSPDKICPPENVRNEPRGCTAPVAWLGQVCPSLFDLHPRTTSCFRVGGNPRDSLNFQEWSRGLMGPPGEQGLGGCSARS